MRTDGDDDVLFLIRWIAYSCLTREDSTVLLEHGDPDTDTGSVLVCYVEIQTGCYMVVRARAGSVCLVCSQTSAASLPGHLCQHHCHQYLQTSCLATLLRPQKAEVAMTGQVVQRL